MAFDWDLQPLYESVEGDGTADIDGTTATAGTGPAGGTADAAGAGAVPGSPAVPGAPPPPCVFAALGSTAPEHEAQDGVFRQQLPDGCTATADAVAGVLELGGALGAGAAAAARRALESPPPACHRPPDKRRRAGRDTYEVECLLASRVADGTDGFDVAWVGYPDSSFEPRAALEGSLGAAVLADLVDALQRRQHPGTGWSCGTTRRRRAPCQPQRSRWPCYMHGCLRR